MNTILTDLTRKIGETIAKIQVNNKLIEDLQKKCNPTFLEILEDIKDNNPSLAASLLLWYCDKYQVDNSDITNLIKSLKIEVKSSSKKTSSRSIYHDTGGCDAPYSSSGGCGSSTRSRSYSDYGCGYTPSSSRC